MLALEWQSNSKTPYKREALLKTMQFRNMDPRPIMREQIRVSQEMLRLANRSETLHVRHVQVLQQINSTADASVSIGN